MKRKQQDAVAILLILDGATARLEWEPDVGISRARSTLVVLVDKRAERALPRKLVSALDD